MVCTVTAFPQNCANLPCADALACSSVVILRPRVLIQGPKTEYFGVQSTSTAMGTYGCHAPLFATNCRRREAAKLVRGALVVEDAGEGDSLARLTGVVRCGERIPDVLLLAQSVVELKHRLGLLAGQPGHKSSSEPTTEPHRGNNTYSSCRADGARGARRRGGAALPTPLLWLS